MSQRYYKPIEKNCHPNELPYTISSSRSNWLGYCASGCASAVESNDTDAAKHGNVLRFFRRADAVLAADGLRRLEHHRFHVSDGFVEAA